MILSADVAFLVFIVFIILVIGVMVAHRTGKETERKGHGYEKGCLLGWTQGFTGHAIATMLPNKRKRGKLRDLELELKVAENARRIEREDQERSSGKPKRPNAEYVGKLDECPNCSSEIPVVSNFCPECGCEVNF